MVIRFDNPLFLYLNSIIVKLILLVLTNVLLEGIPVCIREKTYCSKLSEHVILSLSLSLCYFFQICYCGAEL